MKYGFKIGVIGWIIVFASMYGYANEAQGYKVVLASFTTFDEAKAKLVKLESEMGEGERTLQSKYHFEILARASGKAFILGIEPLETKEVTDEVMKQFQHLYPNAYSNGYFGPTEGAVLLKHTQAAPIVEEMNQTISKKIEIPVESKPIEAVATLEKEEKKTSLLWMTFFGVILLMVAVFIVFKRRISPKKELSSKSDKEVFEVKNEEQIVSEVQSPVVTNTPIIKIESSPSDIFYRLKKNIFFVTLLKELKEASDSKEASRCCELIDEILRYQKNFKKSDIITTLEHLIESKDFEQLSAVLHNEIT